MSYQTQYPPSPDSKRWPASDLPRITVITPSLNRVGMIETAIQSVVDQNYPDVEHIIMDGGSTDGTLDVLKKYPDLRIVSEPDVSMYNALNKGLGLATGEIIGFLNTDDFYAPDVFAQIALNFSKDNVDAVAGLAGIIQQSADIAYNMVVLHPGQGEDLIRHTVLESPIFNAYFFSKRILQKIGPFDTCYKIASDRDFMLRFSLGNFNTILLDQPVYYYLQHPGSMTTDYTETKFREIVDEHLLLSKSYLEAHSKYPSQLVKSMMELRTRETIRECAHCIRQKQFNKAWIYLIEGFRYNPFWLIRFIKHSIVHPIRQEMSLPYRSP
jgi:glycosyltransferase involved in cell wall biosynthesis